MQWSLHENTDNNSHAYIYRAACHMGLTDSPGGPIFVVGDRLHDLPRPAGSSLELKHLCDFAHSTGPGSYSLGLKCFWNQLRLAD
jgi:hypothetical protein